MEGQNYSLASVSLQTPSLCSQALSQPCHILQMGSRWVLQGLHAGFRPLPLQVLPRRLCPSLWNIVVLSTYWLGDSVKLRQDLGSTCCSGLNPSKTRSSWKRELCRPHLHCLCPCYLRLSGTVPERGQAKADRGRAWTSKQRSDDFRSYLLRRVSRNLGLPETTASNREDPARKSRQTGLRRTLLF